MSVGAASTSDIAVLGTARRGVPARERARQNRSWVRLLWFGLLALYGTIKWSNLLSHGATARLLGLVALAILLAAGRPALAKRSRLLAAVATTVALVAVLPIAGVPLEWILHVRIAVSARAIGNGLSALPQVLVPYSGANHLVTLVMVLGAAVLLFDAALLIAFAPGAMEDLRRAGAALPLIALTAVPTTLVRPRLPYVDGAVLFVLLVAFMWGEQIGRRRFWGAFGLGVVAVVASLFLAPAIDRHKPWFNYRALAGSGSPIAVDRFSWDQSYGPLDWPRDGRVVLEVAARQPENWKAENLDIFNGVGWVQGSVPGAESTPAPAASALSRWTQTIRVTVKSMRITQVIGAGTMATPPNLPQGTGPGLSVGTWSTTSDIVPDQSYRVSVYAPNPTDAQLQTLGADYGGLSAAYLGVYLPPERGTPSPSENFLPGEVPSGGQAELLFPAFHSHGMIGSIGGPRHVDGARLIASSPQYGSVYRLARQLASRAATPFQFVQAVANYLGHGYTYSEDTPVTGYPLSTFLLSSRRGYCQHFAGAMALLLRMGGVPARVAVGFTHGRMNSAGTRWVVTDYDAHAWVEVWFPRYGWVTFDPTPPVDPALANNLPISGTTSGLGGVPSSAGSATKQRGAHITTRHSRSSQGARGSSHGGFAAGAELPWLGVAVAVALLGLLLAATRPLRSAEAMVSELEAALRRIGRPLPGGATLSWLERRVGGSPDAASYVRALRAVRFGHASALPTRAQRRALRRELRLGRGPLGIVRAAWALPPRWGTQSGRRWRQWRAWQTRAARRQGA